MEDLNQRLTDIGQKVCSEETELREVGDMWAKLLPIGRGEGRTVLKLETEEFPSEVVVKFAHSRSGRTGGVDQNQYESFMWNNCSSKEKELLAPVFRSDKKGLWLVMQYADPVPEGFDLEPKRDEIYEHLGRRVDSTFRRRNFGIIDGDVKLIDYGYSANK